MRHKRTRAVQMPCAFRSTVFVVLVVVAVRYGRAIITTNNAGWLAAREGAARGGGWQTGQGAGGAHRGRGVAPAGLERCGFSLYIFM